MSWLNISTLSPYGVWHLSRVGGSAPNKRSSPNDCDLHIRQKLIGAKLEPPMRSASCNAMQDSENRMDTNHRWLHGNHSNTNNWKMWPTKRYIHPRKLHMNHCQERRFGIHIIFPWHLPNFKNKCFLLPTINYTSILFWNNPILSYAQSMSLSQLATSMRKVGCPHQLPAARSFPTSTASTWTGLLAISV